MKTIDPYRIFFPVGLLFGIWGTSIWIMNWMGSIQINAIQLHTDLMISGFMFSFVAGFLMTATPKYTGSFVSSFFDISVMLILLIFLAIFAYLGFQKLFHICSFFGMAFLTSFVFRRFLSRENHLYPFYIFLLSGLILGCLGTLIIMMSDLSPMTDNILKFAKALYFQGVVISLIIGVGTSLIPMILGHSNFTVVNIEISGGSLKESFFKSISPLLWFVATLFGLSFFIEFLIHQEIGRFVRAFIVSYILFKTWFLHKWPKMKSKMSVSLWISGWMILIGLWLQVFFPEYSTHVMHLTYVGGFSLMLILIAARVTMAHGGYGLQSEVTSKLLYWIVFLVVFAALTRWSAVYMPKLYESHLAYASFTWIFGIFIWSIFYLKKIIVLNK